MHKGQRESGGCSGNMYADNSVGKAKLRGHFDNLGKKDLKAPMYWI